MTDGKTLAGRMAWVTGSSRGIGRVVAEHLASLGACVAIHGTTPASPRQLGEGGSLADEADKIARAHGVEVLPVHGDLTDPLAVTRIVSEIHAAFDRIDILVTVAGGDIGRRGVEAPNAGKPERNDAVGVSFEDYRVVLDRNLTTCFLCCKEVAPEMMARKAGRIITFGSMSALKGIPQSVVYSAAKAAVQQYTRCLAVQLRPYNITANCIAPGDILTARWKASRPVDPSLDLRDGTLERYGQPIEIARVVGFIASDAASYITGQVLRVDGGTQCWPA